MSFDFATPNESTRWRHARSYIGSVELDSGELTLTHHYAGVELVEPLHGAIAEAVTQVLLHKVRMVQDVIGHQWLLSIEFKRNLLRRGETIKKEY